MSLVRRRDVVIAGHAGDVDVVRHALNDDDADVREVALGALARLDGLDVDTLNTFATDPAPRVRRRVAELSARFVDTDMAVLLRDNDATVVEMAAWACGEHEVVTDAVLDLLINAATEHGEALVREAAVAALGAIGDRRGLPAILNGCADKPAIRRRAVLALAPFDGPEVDAALVAAREDRDWQVRQSAEDVSAT